MVNQPLEFHRLLGAVRHRLEGAHHRLRYQMARLGLIDPSYDNQVLRRGSDMLKIYVLHQKP